MPKQPNHTSLPHTAISADDPFFGQPPAPSQPDKSCSHVCVATRASLHWHHTCSDSRKQDRTHTSEGPPDAALFLDAPGKSAACHTSNYQLYNDCVHSCLQSHPYSRPITPPCTTKNPWRKRTLHSAPYTAQYNDIATIKSGLMPEHML